MTAEGIFAEADVVEELHLRARATKGSHDVEQSSTNANNFWQVEIEKEITKGEPIPWETNIRLRHMLTRRYLQVKAKEVSLTGDLKVGSCFLLFLGLFFLISFFIFCIK